MRKLMTTGFLLGLLTLTALAADVSGKWTAQVPGRGGQAREATFTFKADGHTLSFTQTLEFNGNTMKFLYKGTVSGDEIKFTRTRDGGEGEPQAFTAKRAT